VSWWKRGGRLHRRGKALVKDSGLGISGLRTRTSCFSDNGSKEKDHAGERKRVSLRKVTSQRNDKKEDDAGRCGAERKVAMKRVFISSRLEGREGPVRGAIQGGAERIGVEGG